MMPVAQFDGPHGWGYDGVDLFAPHEAYGGPDGLKRLVDGCHQRGLATILDVVYNHLGPSGNYLERFGPYFHPQMYNTWGRAINFGGPGSDEVRRFFIDNALMWLRDYHFDGLRLDAVHAYMDFSAVNFLEQLAEEVNALEAHLGRSLVLIAESDLNDPRIIRPVAAGGYGIHAQWNDDFHHALHALLTGETAGYYADFGGMAQLAAALQEGYVRAGQYSQFRQRTHGRPAVGVSAHRLLGYLQNHDQIGNRALGERSGQLMSLARLKIGAAIVFTSPFVPMLFQGEEWGASTRFQFFTSHQDPTLAAAVRSGRCAEFAAFGWDPQQIPDPQDPRTFESSKLQWDERYRESHIELLDWHRRLIELRRQTPPLTDGRLAQTTVNYDESQQWMVITRGPVVVAINLSNQPQRLPLPSDQPHRPVLFSVADRPPETQGAAELPAESVVIYVRPESEGGA